MILCESRMWIRKFRSIFAASKAREVGGGRLESFPASCWVLVSVGWECVPPFSKYFDVSDWTRGWKCQHLGERVQSERIRKPEHRSTRLSLGDF